jgi:hypothetical protein
MMMLPARLLGLDFRCVAQFDANKSIQENKFTLTIHI